MNIENLAAQAQSGDSEAFAEICRRFEGLVKRQAFQGHLRSISEDAQAEAWLAVAEAVRRYDPAAGVRFAGYVESCVKYTLWNLFKRERRRWQHEVLPGEGDDGQEYSAFANILIDSTDVAHEAEVCCLGAELRRHIAGLPDRQRRVIVLTLLYDYRLTEAAHELDITVQAAHSLRQRALTRLKKACAGMYADERGC